MIDTIGPQACHQNREDVLVQLEKHKAVFMTSARLQLQLEKKTANFF